MALLSILRYPDERLHTIAQPVESVNGEIRQLIEDLAETMYAAPGVGLAAAVRGLAGGGEDARAALISGCQVRGTRTPGICR